MILCDRCGGQLTTTDASAQYCTQCGQTLSDAFSRQRLLDAGLVPVIYPDPMGTVPAGAIFWELPSRITR